MSQDERCCGSGTCIINAEGWCWCGQRWQGDQLCDAQIQKTQAFESPHPQNKEHTNVDPSSVEPKP